MTLLVATCTFALTVHGKRTDTDIMRTIQKEYAQSLQFATEQHRGYIVVTEQFNPTLYATVQRLAQAMGITTPKDIVIFGGNSTSKKLSQFTGMDAQLNAFSRGDSKNGSILIGDALLTHLTYKELTAVIAHELGHSKHNHFIKIIVPHLIGFYAILGGSIAAQTWLTMSQLSSAKKALGSFLGTITSIGALVWLNYHLCKVSQEYEKEADREALRVIDDKDDLIRALTKLEQLITANVKKSWMHRAFSTHPSVEERAELLTLNATV